MNVPSLREAVDPATRGNLARFAHEVGVSWTTAWRWTLSAQHKDHCIPLKKYWDKIEQATGGRWAAPRTSFNGRHRRPRSTPINIAASRKAAATVRRQREARS